MTLANEELKLVLNNIAAGVLLYKEDGSIGFCSSYIGVLTGYTYEELESLKIYDLFDSIIIKEDKDRYHRAKNICNLGEDSLVRFRIKHKSGLILWLETRMVPVLNEKGTITSIMSISIDVTETFQYQKQIEDQNQDLNDFAYMISHDLKAPIFTIQGMTEALREDFGDAIGSEGLDLINYISNAAGRLTSLVASVLEYSALSNSDETTEEVSLLESIQQVLSDFSEHLKKHNGTINMPEALPGIKGEPVRIYQLFSNLIGNAIKYHSKDRPLIISISGVVTTPNFISLSVEDNGIGIPAHKLEDIFRPYRRAHGGDIEGSGIGLACVKKIVDKIGGKIRVESELNKGSIFTLELPLAKPGERKAPKDLERIF
jgi:PAS domain S-box-containing protein